MGFLVFATEICVQSDDLRGNSKVFVMEAAQYWDGDDLIARVERRWLLVCDGRIAIQTLVWPGYVIILFNELSQKPVEMRLAQHNHVIEQLAA